MSEITLIGVIICSFLVTLGGTSLTVSLIEESFYPRHMGIKVLCVLLGGLGLLILIISDETLVAASLISSALSAAVGIIVGLFANQS